VLLIVCRSVSERVIGRPIVRRDHDFTDALITALPALRRYAVALVGCAVEADDLVQGSIQRAMRRSAQLRELPRMAGWLRRILYNLHCAELLSGKAYSRRHDITELADQLELGAPAAERCAMRALSRAMSQLTVEHRDILLLVSVEELNYREIGEELGIPQGTVMSRLERARQLLRELIVTDSDESATIQPATMEQLASGTRP
jgi:RNA polymerase sigma-70 factor, ECF subfamily